jgi:hypothetical protein
LGVALLPQELYPHFDVVSRQFLESAIDDVLLLVKLFHSPKGALIGLPLFHRDKLLPYGDQVVLESSAWRNILSAVVKE